MDTDKEELGKGKDATFWLRIGSFLLTAELFCLQLCLGAFFAYNLGVSLLTSCAFLLTI